MILDVDVISDVICPWCYIGKRRLESAIAAVEASHEVRVRWLSFQLNPHMPKEGIDRKEYRIGNPRARSPMGSPGRAVLPRQQGDYALRCAAG